MAYNKKTWENLPDTTTPVNATGMNDLETRIDALNTSIINMIGATTTTVKNIPNNMRLSGPDFNTISGTGIFVAFGPCTNVPMYEGVATNHWYLIQIEHNDNNKVQLIRRLSASNGDIYIRAKVSGTWQDWEPSGNTFSTTEKIVGNWIDGKPIYRKVITGTTPADSTATAIGTITSKQNIINLYGTVAGSSANQRVPMNFVYGNSQNSLYNENNNIMFRTTAAAYQSKSFLAVVEYTKTTD